MRQIVSLSAIALGATLFTACQKESNELGAQLIVNESMKVLSIEQSDIKASLVREPSLAALNQSETYHVPSSVNQSGAVFINHFANADTTGIRLHLLVSEE